MSPSLLRRIVACASAAALAAALAPPRVARADAGDPTPAPAVNAPQPGVARVSAIRGNVTIVRADTNETVAAAINAPVLGADYVSTDDGGRAELELDGRSAIRLDENTQMRFTSLAPATRELQLAQGTIDVGLFGRVEHRPQIDTPTVSVRPESEGDYRVTVTSDGQTQITVRHGRAEVITPQGNQEIEPGNTLLALGSADQPTVSIVAEVARDDFDRYVAARNDDIRSTLASTYVNPDIQGASDLDHTGRWAADPQYGHVWVPPVQDPGWAPYQNGRWVWEDYYGWTWVAAEPWGWAPYHYGNWYHSPRFGWAWYPGPVYAPPVWRPALVAFVGFNIGAVRVGLGFGNIGWVPLAPGEPFHPWYGGGRTIVNNVTVTNVYNSSNYGTVNHYRNALVTHGVTAVATSAFNQGNFSRHVLANPAELRAGRSFTTALPVVPNANHLAFTRNAQAVAARPIPQRQFAGNAVAVQRTPFGVQRQTTAAVTHQPYTPDQRFPASRAAYAVPQQPRAGGPSRVPESGAGAPGRTTPTYADPRRPQSPNAPRGATPADSFQRFPQRNPNAAPGTATNGTTPSYARPRNVPNAAPNGGARVPSDAWQRFPQRTTNGAATQPQRPAYAAPRTAPANRPSYSNPRPAAAERQPAQRQPQERQPQARRQRPASERPHDDKHPPR